MTSAEAQLVSYFAKYDPAIAKLGRALRAKLRARLPGLLEVVYVYDSQNALVIAYSPTGRGYDAPCSIGLYPDRVNLFFGQGALLSKSDPNKLLQGRGKTVRHVVLNSHRGRVEAREAASRCEREELRDHQGGGTEAARAPREESSATGLYTSDGESPALTLRAGPRP
jgi:hypothetical protein